MIDLEESIREVFLEAQELVALKIVRRRHLRPRFKLPLWGNHSRWKISEKLRRAMRALEAKALIARETWRDE